MRRLLRSGSTAQAGFTLVEMLIALLIFGMLTAGGVALLSFSVSSQEFTDRQLATLGSLRRAGALMTTDLAQATARPWRDAQGLHQPAFVGSASGATPLIVLVRAGWDNPDQLPRPSLQRVEYRLQNNRLLRIGYAAVDGGGASAVTALIDDVEQLRLRYRAADGTWRDSWQPTDQLEMPTAVELTVSSPRFGPVRQVFQVGGAR
jgi:general secretion pathway protein J